MGCSGTLCHEATPAEAADAPKAEAYETFNSYPKICYPARYQPLAFSGQPPSGDEDGFTGAFTSSADIL